jgi:metallophosphoesterase (TIGR00282 family)
MKKNIRILFIGDIVGTDALAMVTKLTKTLSDKYRADAVIANGENIHDGKSLNKKHAAELFNAGVCVITTGNHVWDRWEAKPLLWEERRILRPLNYPRENGGSGFIVIDIENIGKIGVMNLQGRTFLPPIDCPFKAADWALEKIHADTKVIIVDIHAEASAEKQAMGRYLDGRVSAVLGTHTHVQTADERILPGGTAYITDVGMTGPYDSCVGLRSDVAIKRFMMLTPFKYEIAKDEIKIAGVVMEIDGESGRAISIEKFMYPEFTTTTQ